MPEAVKIYFNELSVEPELYDKNKVAAAAQQFLNSVQYASNSGMKLYTPEDFTELQLGKDYYWHDFINSRRGGWDLQRRYKTYIANGPTYSDVAPYCSVNCEKAMGITHAYKNDSIAISLNSGSACNNDSVTALYNGTEEVTVKHVSSEQHLKQHRGWLLRYMKEAVPSRLCKKYIAIYFRRLKPCDNTFNQLKGIVGSDSRKVMKILFQLNAYCLDWDDGGFDKYKYSAPNRISGESESTMNMYDGERRMKCSDGVSRIFTWHAKPAGNLRVYFYPCEQSKSMHIGYIGPHLRT